METTETHAVTRAPPQITCSLSFLRFELISDHNGSYGGSYALNHNSLSRAIVDTESVGLDMGLVPFLSYHPVCCAFGTPTGPHHVAGSLEKDMPIFQSDIKQC